MSYVLESVKFKPRPFRCSALGTLFGPGGVKIRENTGPPADDRTGNWNCEPPVTATHWHVRPPFPKGESEE